MYFYCFPQILGMLHHQYPEYTDDILKKIYGIVVHVLIFEFLINLLMMQ